VPYFRDGEFKRVSQKLHPGWSRLYARVLREGTIQIGEPVRVQ
jgi:MOSC domain-containing protein YiiM